MCILPIVFYPEMRYTIINEREVIKMKIIKKEILEFSERETDAISLVIEICNGLMREANDPNLKELAEDLYDRITTLWGWEE